MTFRRTATHLALLSTIVGVISLPSGGEARPLEAEDFGGGDEASSEKTQGSVDSILRQDGPAPSRDLHVSAFVDLGSYSAFMFGVGGIVTFPVVEKGFLKGINDAFYVEGGLRLATVNFSVPSIVVGPNGFPVQSTTSITQVLLHPFGGVRWDFHFSKEFSAYPLARIGALLSIDNGGGGFYIATGVGGAWRFSETFGLRAELVGGSSSGVALSVGGSMFF